MVSVIQVLMVQHDAKQTVSSRGGGYLAEILCVFFSVNYSCRVIKFISIPS